MMDCQTILWACRSTASGIGFGWNLGSWLRETHKGNQDKASDYVIGGMMWMMFFALYNIGIQKHYISKKMAQKIKIENTQQEPKTVTVPVLVLRFEKNTIKIIE